MSRGHQIEVAVLAPARLPAGAQRQHGKTSDETDVDAVGPRLVDDVERFVEHLVPPAGRRR